VNRNINVQWLPVTISIHELANPCPRDSGFSFSAIDFLLEQIHPKLIIHPRPLINDRMLSQHHPPMLQTPEDFPRILVPFSLVVRLVVDFTYVGGESREARAVPAAEGMRAEETEEGWP
jgi:hypothetical protein